MLCGISDTINQLFLLDLRRDLSLFETLLDIITLSIDYETEAFIYRLF